MSPVTHFLVGWTALERLMPQKRDKALVALAGVAPDLDGLGIIVDLATRTLGLPETDYYQMWHRIYGHGLFPAIVIAAVCAALAKERVMVAFGALIAALLHFVCDVLGSRGNGPEDLWGIYPLAPFSLGHEIVWTGQWELISWQNTAITAALIVIIAARALRTGYSPLALVSPRADAQFVATLHKWRRSFGARV